MKLVYQILTYILLRPFGCWAQDAHDDHLDFYVTLALKDAKREQNFKVIAKEDAQDFWEDQLRFEKQLLEKNAEAHKAYLNGKHIAYNRHQKECQGHGHDPSFYLQASYYILEGAFSLNGEPILSAKEPEKNRGIPTQRIPE